MGVVGILHFEAAGIGDAGLREEDCREEGLETHRLMMVVVRLLMLMVVLRLTLTTRKISRISWLSRHNNAKDNLSGIPFRPPHSKYVNEVQTIFGNTVLLVRENPGIRGLESWKVVLNI